MLSCVDSRRYRNSKQWVLERLASAAMRLGARMFRAKAACDDPLFHRRMAGHIDTVSAGALLRFVQAHDSKRMAISISVGFF